MLPSKQEFYTMDLVNNSDFILCVRTGEEEAANGKIYHIFCQFGLWVFENRALRRIFGTRGDEMTGSWENCKTRRFITCTLPQV
jgi:hypothetical protein